MRWLLLYAARKSPDFHSEDHAWTLLVRTVDDRRSIVPFEPWTAQIQCRVKQYAPIAAGQRQLIDHRRPMQLLRDVVEELWLRSEQDLH